jgi:type I restriction enzyme, S subunit
MKTKISTFLKERPERFKPVEANKLNLKRLQKIDFSGNMHFLEDKKTNTGMILGGGGER